MDWFKIFLAVFILGLNLSFCEDDPHEHDELTIISELNESGSSGHEAGDTCSVFCDCECCGPTITEPPFIPLSLMALISEQNELKKLALPSKLPFDIWEPPKG